MDKAYIYDKESKKFLGEIQCQIDPLESQLARKTIYLLPGNATYKKPEIEEKEGFDIVWNEDTEDWEYKEKKKDTEPEPYVPTELDKARESLWEYKNKLFDTDYINDKISDALNTSNTKLADELRSKYASVFADREEWRKEVRKWEGEVERLEVEQTNV